MRRSERVTLKGARNITSVVMRAAGGVIDWLTTAARTVAMFVLLALTLATAFDVYYRAAEGAPLNGLYEMSSVALVVIVHLAMADTQRAGGHVTADLLTRYVPPRVSALLEAVGLAIVVAVIVSVIPVTYELALLSLQRNEMTVGLARVPLWPGRWAVAIGMSLLAVELLRTLVGRLASLGAPRMGLA